MSTNDNTSTLKSYVDSATGAVQSGVAYLTGSAGDRANADESKTKAQAEHDLSHSAAKAGPFTISSTGAPAKDNSDRTQGQWDQTIGSVKEATGNLLGNQDLKQQGREQNLQGQGQEAKGQLSDLGQGVSDRLGGAVGGAYASLTGNKAAQQAYQDQHVSVFPSTRRDVQLTACRTKARPDSEVSSLIFRRRPSLNRRSRGKRSIEYGVPSTCSR